MTETLPADIARCEGMDWDPFGVQPECLDCKRYSAGRKEGERAVVWMDVPKKRPCEERIPE